MKILITDGFLVNAGGVSWRPLEEIGEVIYYDDTTPEELLERMELFYRLWNALNSLPETQGRRVDAHIILGMSYREIARAEGVDWSSVKESVRGGLAAMRKFLKRNF